jgi:PAS domain S-box-containing protein
MPDPMHPVHDRQHFAETLPVAVYTTDAAGYVTYFNEAAAELAGRRPEIGHDRWCVTWRLYWPDGRSLPHDQCPMAIALKENRTVRGAEAIAERPNGTRVSFTPFPTPIRDASGSVIGGVNVLINISDRTRDKKSALLAQEKDRTLHATLLLVETILAECQQGALGSEARNLLGVALQRITALGAAHGLLLHGGSDTRIDLWDFLSAACVTIQGRLPQGLQLRCQTSAGDLCAETALPLALIVRELIACALDDCAPEVVERVISVEINRDRADYILSVHDSHCALHIERRNIGRSLVKALARQLNGTLSIDPAKSRCIVRFRDAMTLN